MLILSLTLVAIVVPGLAAALVAYRWPQSAPTAPKLDVDTVQSEVRKHPGGAGFVRSRLDPNSVTGLVLTAGVILFVVGTAAVAIVLIMIHTNSGFARLDRS